MEQPCCTREAHEAVKNTPAWATYHLVGRMSVDEDHALELRNCPVCHSTLAVEVDAQS